MQLAAQQTDSINSSQQLLHNNLLRVSVAVSFFSNVPVNMFPASTQSPARIFLSAAHGKRRGTAMLCITKNTAQSQFSTLAAPATTMSLDLSSTPSLITPNVVRASGLVIINKLPAGIQQNVDEWSGIRQ
jgi:hypothetical protein